MGNLRVFSSFWLWFAGAMLLNQLALAIILYFSLLNPATQSIAGVLTGLSEAIHEIKTAEGPEGLNRFQEKISYIPNIALSRANPEAQSESTLYPGLNLVKKNIENLSNQKLEVFLLDNRSTSLRIYESQDPSISLEYKLLGKPMVLPVLLWSIAAHILISAIAAYWIATRVTTPIQNLAHQARQLADRDDAVTIEVQQNAPPELKSLAATLNDMRHSLDQVVSDREQLLAMITHDLRTPLSRLSIGLELIKSTAPKPADALLSDVEEMGSLINQFIELSKLNHEVDEPWQTGSLNDFVDAIVAKYHRSGVDIFVDLPSARIFTDFKPLALTRVIYNLIDNAIRHGTGNIRISLLKVGLQIELRVSNDIAPNKQQQSGLIEAFMTAGSKQFSGTGLGLKIIQQFTRVHDADLTVSIEGNTIIHLLRFHSTQI